MSKLDKLERIVDEVEAGLDKLDKGDIWTSNSSSASLFIVSQILFWLSILNCCIDTYYWIKRKTYWRLKFRRF